METELEFVKKNRQRLYAQLPAGSLFIVQSNDVHPTNADGTFPYKPNHDLYYLTGIRQEGSVFMAFPDFYRQDWQEVLLLPPADPEREQWMGRNLSPAAASAVSGISTVSDTSHLNEFLQFYMLEAGRVWLQHNDHARRESPVITSAMQLASRLRSEYPGHTFDRLSNVLHPLRAIKQGYELEQMKKAIGLSKLAFEAAAKSIRAGKTEYQLEADFYHPIRYGGGDWADYRPIIASGEDSCVLHYHRNNKEMKAGGLVLIDAAAAYQLYQSDITRVFPVDGKFSTRQKAVYNAVLASQQFISGLMRPGRLLTDVFFESKLFIFEQLQQLGLTVPGKSYSQAEKMELAWKYSFHNPSHPLGLDVHDVMKFSMPLQAGMVLTNEPGIYIRGEGIGIRLENNMLITEEQAVNLSEEIPVEAEEVEAAME